MQVFLRNVPVDTTINQISTLIGHYSNSGFLSWFGAKTEIANIEILEQRDERQTSVSVHGLVTIKNDKAALRVIKRMKRTKLKGYRIQVREYITRTWHNDHRDQDHLNLKLPNDRRKKERRKATLVVSKRMLTIFDAKEQYLQKPSL